MSRLNSIFCAFTIALLLQACKPESSLEPHRYPVRIALTRSPIAYLPVSLAKELGHYEDEGLDVTISDAAGATKAMQSLLGGSADVSAVTYEQVLPLVAQGQELKAFRLLLGFRTQALVVSPRYAHQIRSVLDLRGKPVGVGSLGGPNHNALNVILRQHGLSPSDIQPVQVGTLASVLSALEHGKVPAAIVNSSEYYLLTRRHPELRVLYNALGPEGTRKLCGGEECPTTVLIARTDWLDAHPEAARKVAGAITRTVAWIQSHSPEEVREKMPGTYRMAEAAADLAALKLTIPGYSATGIMTQQAAEATRKLLLIATDDERIAHMDLSRTFTNEFASGGVR